MREDLRCALNGEEMIGLDPRLYINDIDEKIKVSPETGNRPHYGQTLVGVLGHDSIAVTITFIVKECDRAARQGVIQKVNGWAKEGWLTLSTRPQQRLYVHCTQPVSNKAFSRSEELTVVFMAYDEAYWQEAVPQSAAMSGTTGSVTVRPFGTRECCLEASITNTSEETVQALTLAANGFSWTFEGLSLAAGETLDILYDQRNVLSMSVGNVSKLACRTGTSADDLLLYPAQENTVQFVADQTCDVTLYVRGRYD